VTTKKVLSVLLAILNEIVEKQKLLKDAKIAAEAKVSVELKDLQEQIAAIENEKAAALQAVNDKWGEAASQISEIPVAAQKSDILLDFFGVAWMPYHLVKTGEQLIELRGFSTKKYV